MEKRIWIGTGIIEELDTRQVRFLELVLGKIKYYYRNLYRREGNPHPLSLSKLMELTNRNSIALTCAIRLLANSISEGFEEKPPIYYQRVKAKNSHNRPYLIFLNRN